jgi:hypothetical protein
MYGGLWKSARRVILRRRATLSRGRGQSSIGEPAFNGKLRDSERAGPLRLSTKCLIFVDMVKFQQRSQSYESFGTFVGI